MQLSSYLHAMGIQEWQLIHPQRLAGYTASKEALDQQIRLLLVSEAPPLAAQLPWLERVLNSFHLSLEQAAYVSPSQLGQVMANDVEWIWVVDSEHRLELGSNSKVLRTANLTEVENSLEHRRDLWRQICAYGQ